MARCTLMLALCFAFAVQGISHRIKAKVVVDNTSPHAWSREALAPGVVNFWLLGWDQLGQWGPILGVDDKGETWHGGPGHWTSGHWTPLAVRFDRNAAWTWVNNVGSSCNVYWALHCFQSNEGGVEKFGWLDNGSFRSSPYHLGQRSYHEFWADAQLNIKKWYDAGVSEAQAKIHDQMVLDMAGANIHDQMEMALG